jgi:sterol desaturase/sphingolipid hydroxylase (fatty acid hydroxylase superfamily)
MSKLGYYGEFFFYPVAVVVSMAAITWRGSVDRWTVVLGAFAAGALLWTLVEYLLHRYILHHLPYIKEMHEAHHNEQDALIGTPIWVSLASFAGLLVIPLWFTAGPIITAATTAGMMLGYFWFESVHHVLHHWTIKPGTYAFRLKRRHMLHHHFDNAGNFGVTNGLWDVVFGTNVTVRAAGDKTSSATRG